jgi:hypothetical protein
VIAFETAFLLPIAFVDGIIATMIGVGGGMHACNYFGIGCK